jgi:glycosyltransferase involved in cell wall biosynthesis
MEKLFPKKVVVVPNGIEMTEQDEVTQREKGRRFRELHEIPVDVPLIGTVGQLVPLKGQRDLILAAAEIVKKVPDAHFVIVGQDNTTDKKYRRELKRLARVLELEDRTLWLDWADDLPSLLAALDVYVSPSHSESFGIATLEAMAARTPVVATRTDGSLELLGKGDHLVPFGDPVKLARRTVELLSDEELRRSLTMELRQRAVENYSLDKMAERIESIYREVLANKDGR